MTPATAQEDRFHSLLASAWKGLPIILCGLAGFLSAFTVSVIGQLPIGELVLLLVFPWVLVRTYNSHAWTGSIQQLRWYNILFVTLGLMAIGYVVSDLYRGNASANFIKGWARVGLLAIDLVAIAYLIDNSWRRLYVFYFALQFGATLNSLFSYQVLEDWWKYGLGYALTALVFFVFAGRFPLLQVIVAVALGALSLALGSRNLGGICLLTGGLFWLRYARGGLRLVAVLVSVGALVAMYIAANTVFLENQQHEGSNIERQSMIETAGEAFLSSPLIGQGSWFATSRLMHRLEDRIASKDPNFQGYSDEEASKITIHSQLLVSLAEGGILGGIFFLGLGLLLLKTLLTLLTNPLPRRAFLFYLVIGALWDLCMSPFSGQARVQIILSVCVCLLVILQRRGELADNYKE
jgi:O-antigen ligase